MFKKDKKEDARPRSIVWKVKWSLIALVLLIVVGLLGYGGVLLGGKMVVGDADLVLDAATTIETADGKVIQEIYQENRDPVTLNEIPSHVQQAFLAVEDRRFYEHAGIDLKSLIRAVYKNILAMGKVEGGSTITQQLAKNLFLYNDKTWSRKAKEAMAAIYLEQQLAKDEILELYMNEIYFGEGIYGIEKAAAFYFSKSAEELTITEGALLAGMAKAPNGYSPITYPEKALNRRNTVLLTMEDAGIISEEQLAEEQEKDLGMDVSERQASPWVDSYVDLVMREAAGRYELPINELKRGGYRLVVNLDEEAQRIAYENFQEGAYFPGNTEGEEGAFIMMEQETGRVTAAIGGRDYQLGDLNRTAVTRQPGSVMKPTAVYGPALMQKEKYTPYTLVLDQPMEGYTVSNVDDQYSGAVSIFEAIKQSKNTSAVWLLDQIGIDYAKGYLEKMDIRLEDDNGLAIALGGLSEGLTPQTVMESYAVFARGGEFIDSYTIEEIYDRHGELVHEAAPETAEVFSTQVAWNMTEMLIETVESGTASAGEYTKELAGKTGSTQHPFVPGETNDAWFAGYTPDYTVALWMGYDKVDEEHYLTEGSSYPTKLAKKILTEIDQQKPFAESFEKPVSAEPLPEPIKLPQITGLQGSVSFGGYSLMEGKLTWTGSADERVHYRVYREKEGIDERVGEVEGKTEFYVDGMDVLRAYRYYVVPYNPLTKLEGERSETISFRN
ncbi:transglycosylase domain-containing protein [Virgibacillus xinjiangensis]|uniref:Transglycosylase domain-containing protein n=1 Tax=Virgibacillus xinjiangensis TaxID=393090 RepID=A0ABV7CWD0_9BACI